MKELWTKKQGFKGRDRIVQGLGLEREERKWQGKEP